MNALHNPHYRKGGLLARVRPDLAATLPDRPEPRPAPIDNRPTWIKRLAANAKVLA